MTKRPQKAERRARRNEKDDDERERVSLSPLDPVEALKGLLATPPPEAEPKPRKRKTKG